MDHVSEWNVIIQDTKCNTFPVQSDSKVLFSEKEYVICTDFNPPSYNFDTIVKVNDTYYVKTTSGFEKALLKNLENIKIVLLGDVELLSNGIDSGVGQNPLGGNKTESITITGVEKYKLTFNNTNSDYSSISTNNNAKLILNDLIVDKSGYSADGGPWNAHDVYFNCDVEMNNVTCLNAIALAKTSVLNDVKISDSNATADAYVVWIVAGADVTMDHCTIDGTSAVGKENRAIAIKEQYNFNPGMTVLKVSNTTISSDKYAAVLVTSAGGAEITWNSNDISGTQDNVNAVWYDGNGENITVTGCEKKAR